MMKMLIGEIALKIGIVLLRWLAPVRPLWARLVDWWQDGIGEIAAAWIWAKESPSLEIARREMLNAHYNARCVVEKPSPPLPHGEGSKDEEQPLMIDAALLNMEPEIGLAWQRYPSVRNIQRTLRIDRKRARWLHDVCKVEGDLALSILMINDMARMMRIAKSAVVFVVDEGKVINLPVEWKHE